ncbi:MAG: rhodanese-like domain-containing protein [Bacteroidota bacterium]|jgi:phage shock protein E
MKTFIMKWLGFSAKHEIENAFLRDPQIIDVRTNTEYSEGHIPGSLNIPLHRLEENLHRLNKNRPVITCCASGMRSASAQKFLESSGYNEVYNGGSWHKLQRRINAMQN